MRPSNWKLYMRTQRLISERKERVLEQQLEADQKRALKMRIDDLPSIIGKLFLVLNLFAKFKNENNCFQAELVILFTIH